MEKSKSPREIALDGIPQVATFWLLAEGPKCREPHGGNLLYPRKFPLSFVKSRRDRHPICGKMDTQTLLNLPLHSAAPALPPRGSREWSSWAGAQSHGDLCLCCTVGRSSSFRFLGFLVAYETDSSTFHNTKLIYLTMKIVTITRTNFIRTLHALFLRVLQIPSH